MENPWATVDGSSGDWRHPDDKGAIRTVVRLPPQPWLGTFDEGRVCWLLGGFGTGDNMAYDDPACRPLVEGWALRNLGGAVPSEPNAWLDPFPDVAAVAATRDVVWWLRATRALREATSRNGEGSRSLLARRLFVLEAYPYPMATNPGRQLPTHRYTRYLLEQWIHSGRPIVVGRGRRFWTDLVPSLQTALSSGQAIETRNPQSASISPGNLPGGAGQFDSIVHWLMDPL